MNDHAARASRLVEARKAAGFASKAEAARALGVSYPTYAGHENPNAPSTFQTEAAELYARKFKVSFDWLVNGRGEMRGPSVVPVEIPLTGLPILGEIRAGHWLDMAFATEDPEPEILPAARDPRFPRARQYALKVTGDSMDREYPDGSYVTCVDYAESGLRIVPGLTVHVERRRDNGQLVEITLKEVARRGSTYMLIPRSSNPAHQPITFTERATDVVIRGVVTGSFRQTFIPT